MEGFYKYEENNLMYAEHSVSMPGIEIHVRYHSEYVYPINGWHYFESREDAIKYLIGIDDIKKLKDLNMED